MSNLDGPETITLFFVLFYLEFRIETQPRNVKWLVEETLHRQVGTGAKTRRIFSFTKHNDNFIIIKNEIITSIVRDCRLHRFSPNRWSKRFSRMLDIRWLHLVNKYSSRHCHWFLGANQGNSASVHLKPNVTRLLILVAKRIHTGVSPAPVTSGMRHKQEILHYRRCESKKQCIRPFETKCEEAPNIGGQKDEHGCLIGAGFTWYGSVSQSWFLICFRCENSKQCIQPWQTKCADGQSGDGVNGNGGSGNGGNGTGASGNGSGTPSPSGKANGNSTTSGSTYVTAGMAIVAATINLLV